MCGKVEARHKEEILRGVERKKWKRQGKMFMATTTATAARQQLGYRRWQFIVQQHRKILLCSRLAKRNASTITFHQPYNEIFFTLRYELFSFAINNFLIRAKSSITEIRNKRCTILLQRFCNIIRRVDILSSDETRWEETKCLKNRRFVYPEVSTSFNREENTDCIATTFCSTVLSLRGKVPDPPCEPLYPFQWKKRDGKKGRGSGGNKKRQKEREVKIYVIIYA